MKLKKISPLFLKKIEDPKQKASKGYKVIISFKKISERDKFISKNKDLKIRNTFDLIPALSVQLNKDNIFKFENEDSIEQIEEDQRLFLSILEINQILNIDNYKRSQISYTGKNINVGIIDEGINSKFQAIRNISKNYFNKSGIFPNEITHGTLMASIIANQYKNDEANYIGIAPNVKLIDFNIANSQKEYYVSHILSVFDVILNENSKLDLLLISFSTSEPSDGKDILSQACNLLVDSGIIIVCPAGNDGSDSHTIGSPSAASKVISFGAVNKELEMENYSKKGPTIDNRMKPDFCYPGTEIKVPLDKDLVVMVTGTSVAAAIGVGLIALLREYNNDLTYDVIYDILRNSSKDLGIEKSSQGHGMPDIVDIFKRMKLFHERIVPYNVLAKRAIKISIEFIILFLVIYFLFLIF
ncbi:MAG: S8 family serine peptidase [Promethearchaeota archaeon]